MAGQHPRVDAKGPGPDRGRPAPGRGPRGNPVHHRGAVRAGQWGVGNLLATNWPFEGAGPPRNGAGTRRGGRLLRINSTSSLPTAGADNVDNGWLTGAPPLPPARVGNRRA